MDLFKFLLAQNLYLKRERRHLRWLPRVITNIVLIERELENET